MSLLNDEIMAFLGSEVTYIAPEPLGAAAIRYFAIATGDSNPLYHDEAVARTSRFHGVVAPPTLVCETNQYMRGPLPDDGNMGHEWRLPVQNARVLRGGNEYQFIEPVRPEHRLRVTWRIDRIFEKVTERGALLFVISEARYYDHADEKLLVINRETNIYQELAN